MKRFFYFILILFSSQLNIIDMEIFFSGALWPLPFQNQFQTYLTDRYVHILFQGRFE